LASEKWMKTWKITVSMLLCILPDFNGSKINILNKLKLSKTNIKPNKPNIKTLKKLDKQSKHKNFTI